MLIKILLIILIVFILIHKHFFYHMIISNLKILFWLRNKDYKQNLKQRKLTKEIGVEQFFLSKEKEISFDVDIPYYDKQYIFKRNNILELLNYKNFGKSDSLPHTINSFTTPFKFNGEWIGDSIFRMDYEIRKNRKEQYLSALTKNRVIHYQTIIKNHIPQVFITNKEINLFDSCHKLCIDMLFILHLGIKPNKEDYKDIQIFIKAVAQFPMGIFFNKAVIHQLYNLKFFHQKIIQRIKNLDENTICIVNDWIKSGMNINDIFIEFIHNIIGMVTNWVNTVYPYIVGISNNDIPKIKTGLEKEYILESFRYIMPVKFVSSKIKNPNLEDISNKNSKENGYYNAIHNLLEASRDSSWGEDKDKFNLARFQKYHKHLSTNGNGKCPFYHSKQNAKVPQKYSIYERDNYTPFGIGYRRCPGEFLSMAFLEELALFVKDKKITIKLKNNISKKEHYVFDIKETNYIVDFKKKIENEKN